MSDSSDDDYIQDMIESKIYPTHSLLSSYMDDYIEFEEGSNFLPHHNRGVKMLEEIFRYEKFKNDDYNDSSTFNDSSINNIALFLPSKKNNENNLTPNKKIYFKCEKRIRTRERNINNRYDNMKKKITRHFFNTFLVGEINRIIKESGSHLKFRKFPRNFFNNLNDKTINTIWNLTLENIMTKDLYLSKNSDSNNLHNSDVINKLKSEENKDIIEKMGIKKEIKNLFEEYLESKYYRKKIESVGEKFEEKYVEKYDYYSKHFVK